MTERTILDQLSYKELPAVLVSATLPDDEPFGDDPLDELESLAETAGMYVVGKIYQNVERINPRTYIGKGKVGEVAKLVEETEAKVVIFDRELRPLLIRSFVKAGVKTRDLIIVRSTDWAELHGGPTPMTPLMVMTGGYFLDVNGRDARPTTCPTCVGTGCTDCCHTGRA